MFSFGMRSRELQLVLAPGKGLHSEPRPEGAGVGDTAWKNQPLPLVAARKRRSLSLILCGIRLSRQNSNFTPNRPTKPLLKLSGRP